MLLYRVEPGGSCIITSSCLLAHSPYSARGIAEAPLSLLLLPPSLFEQLLAENQACSVTSFSTFLPSGSRH
jgi:CRP/FNR family transcriptional regulator